MPKRHEDRKVRRYGTGSFEYRERERKGGGITRFAYGFVYSQYPRNSKGNRRHYASGQTIRAAEAKAKAKAAKHDEEYEAFHALGGLKVPSLGDCFQEFIDSKRLTESSKKKYRSWKKHLCEFGADSSVKALGDFKPDEISVALLDKAFCKYKSEHYGKSPGNFRDVLSEFWEWMARRSYVKKNLVPQISKGSRRSTKTSLTVSQNDLKQLFAVTTDVRIQAVIILGLHNLRIGEILGLTEDRISGNTVQIRRQLKAVKNPRSGPQNIHGLAELKSASAERNIVLTDTEMAVVQQALRLGKHHEIYDAVTKQFKQKRFVISNEDGNRWCYNGFRRIWVRAVRKAGLEVTAHDLRRLFTTGSFSSANDSVLNPSAVSRALGHADLDTTMIYNYVDEADLLAVHEAASIRVLSLLQ